MPPVKKQFLCTAFGSMGDKKERRFSVYQTADSYEIVYNMRRYPAQPGRMPSEGEIRRHILSIFDDVRNVRFEWPMPKR